MSANDKKKEDRSTNAAIIVAIIGFLATIIAALLSTFKDPLNALLFPTPTPIIISSTVGQTLVGSPSTPTYLPSIVTSTNIASNSTLSPAAQVVDFYFRFINYAKDKDELIQSWNIMTTNFQCNPSDQCQFSKFQNWWWQWHIHYEVYDCGLNTVIVRYNLVPRSQPSTPPTTTYYERYTLIDEDGNLKLNEGHPTSGLDNSCTPAIGSQ